MIIISTYNGKEFLKVLLDDLKNFNISNEKVCIVDNKSSNKLHLDYIEKLKKENYIILHNPKNSFEVGAYKYALANVNDDFYFCMQDSIHLKEDIFSYVIPKLTTNNIYTFLTAKNGLYDSNTDRFILSLHYNTFNYSQLLFGCNIFGLHSVLNKMKEDWFIPINKLDAMAAERALGLVCDKHNIKIESLGIYDPPKSGSPDGYSFFSKTYAAR